MDDQQNAVYQNPAAYEDTTPLSVGKYVGMMILTAIPILGLIMTLIWAFSGNTNINKKNYARAALILLVIGYVISIILAVTGVFTFGKIFGAAAASAAF